MPELSIENEVFSRRLLVFLEVEPQSNEYNQVFLTNEQFKKVSDAICCEIKKAKDTYYDEDVVIDSSDEVYYLPDLREIKS